MSSRNFYQLAIHHPGLNKHRVIRGVDRLLVEAAAAAQHRAWAEQFVQKVAVEERRREREAQQRETEGNLREAEQRTTEAQAALEELRGILAATLKVDDRVDWSSLMQPPFAEPRPRERGFLSDPVEPVFDPQEWKKSRSFVTALLPFLARRAEAAAKAEFDAAHAKWRERMAATKATNDRIYRENLRDFEEWQHRAASCESSREQHNASIEQAHAAYQALDQDAVTDYCDLVLSISKYADCFPKEYDLEYRPTAKTLVVHYRLPAPEALPRLDSVKFVKTKNAFVETELSKRESEQLYSDVVFQVALRTVHELFEADVVRALDVVNFNGSVMTLNAGTGHQEDRCILSVRAARNAFEAVNLRSVEPRACFESLGGVAGAKLLDCRAVKPLEVIDHTDARFAAAQAVSSADAGGSNEWRELTSAISDPQEIRFLSVGAMVSLLGFPLLEKFSVALSRQIVEAVAARGFALEPDARFGAAGYRAEDEIALFRPLETPVTAAYPGAAALLQLSLMIAAADEHPTEAELEIAREFIRKNAALTTQEQQRLVVLEQYLCRNSDKSSKSLTRLAKRLPEEQRQLVGEVLVCVAGADGVISSAEWQALDRACKALELSQSALDEILRKLGADFAEPTVQEAATAQPGEAIPAAPTFKLDMSRVAAISHETAQVISILSAVMDDSEPARPAVVSASAAAHNEPDEPPSNAPDWLGSLAEKYREIASRIVCRPSWSRAEFQTLAAEFKLMPLGVVDALNEWSDEQLGDFLLEGEDPVTVNQFILPKQP